jgi:hypothetical protein
MPSAFVQVTDLKCVSVNGNLRSTEMVRKGCLGAYAIQIDRGEG